MDITAKDLAQKSGISERTVRTTYRGLRRKLIEAAIYNPDGFGGAGSYLLRKGKIDDKGKRFFRGVAESELYTSHLERHAPRLNSMEDRTGLIFEVAIRVFCNVHLDEGVLIDYPEETKNAVLQLRDMGRWIKENQDRKEFQEKYGHIIERFMKVAHSMRLLLEKEELLVLKTKSREHKFPWDLLYDDLRRYLLKYPL